VALFCTPDVRSYLLHKFPKFSALSEQAEVSIGHFYDPTQNN